MTNGFQPPPNFGQPPQFAQQQQYAQPPAPQAPQFGGQPQTNGFFAQQPQPATPQFQQQAQQSMPQMPASAEVEDTEGYFAGGAAWISWDTDKGYVDGTPRGGLIVGKRIVPQTDIDTGEIRYQKKGDTSKPLTMLVLTIQTAERADPDDDGRREMPIKSGLRSSAKTAFEAVGAKDLEIGGWFYAARIRKEPIPNSSFKRNIFDAIYARPGSPDPMQGRAAYQAPPQPVAMQAPQPSAPADQYAAYAAAQAAQQQFAQTVQPPAQFNPMMAAQSNGVASGFVPQQPTAPQFQGMAGDPNHQAATEYPTAQPAQQPQGFMPGVQTNGVPQQPTPPPTPSPGAPGQWTPFS
jgi:hypothetical protein